MLQTQTLFLHHLNLSSTVHLQAFLQSELRVFLNLLYRMVVDSILLIMHSNLVLVNIRSLRINLSIRITINLKVSHNFHLILYLTHHRPTRIQHHRYRSQVKYQAFHHDLMFPDYLQDPVLPIHRYHHLPMVFSFRPHPRTTHTLEAPKQMAVRALLGATKALQVPFLLLCRTITILPPASRLIPQ